MDLKALMEEAAKAREKAYVPYSRFAVGAAVLGGSGKVYPGCNVENASYGLSICAERTAVAKAVSEGEREIKAVAVVADVPGFCSPCGACRQVLAEFGPRMPVIMGNTRGEYQVRDLNELLPEAFNLEDVN